MACDIPCRYAVALGVAENTVAQAKKILREADSSDRRIRSALEMLDRINAEHLLGIAETYTRQYRLDVKAPATAGIGSRG